MTGACVLVIEIVALRVLSPYYGNTIFSAPAAQAYRGAIIILLRSLPSLSARAAFWGAGE